MRSNGLGRPGKWHRKLLAARFWLQERMPVLVDVGEGEASTKFVCDNMLLVRRATTLFVKEEGTVDWLKQSLGPGKVFLDVGANIGVYTLLAAQLVGEGGHVYAAEPHVPNAQRLFENIAANGLEGRVSVITAAIAETSSFGDFHYSKWYAGSSHSQYETDAPANGKPVLGTREVKLGVSVDTLIEAGVMTPPDAIKIDIDGLETEALRGMVGLLKSDRRPETVQVEVQPETIGPVTAFFEELAYDFTHRHFTQGGKKYLARGVPEAEIPHNLVYRRREG